MSALADMVGRCLELSMKCIASTLSPIFLLRSLLSHFACSLLGWVAFNSNSEQLQVQHQCTCECFDRAFVRHGEPHVEMHVDTHVARTAHLDLSVSEPGDSQSLISNSTSMSEIGLMHSASWSFEGFMLLAACRKWWVARPR